MANRLILFVLFYFCLCNTLAYSKNISGKKDQVKVFIKGQEYVSPDAYRINNLKKYLQENLFNKDNYDNYDVFVKKLFNYFSVQKWSDFNEEELDIISKKLYENKVLANNEKKIKEHKEVSEMENMLDLYKRERGIKTPSVLDVSKIKTILIKKPVLDKDGHTTGP